MRLPVLAPIVTSALLSLFVAGCSAEVVVRSAPPPDREEPAVRAPSDNHFWVRGHWEWNGRDYQWVAGHWEARRATHVWVAGHWRHVSGGYVWAPGRWTTR